jgi:hypothetical protein
MTQLSLHDTVADVPSMRGIFITAMPDCLLYDSWMRPNEPWIPDEAASYFGDLIRANREALKALQAWSAEMQVTIESAGLLLIIRELRTDFLVTLAFDRNVPLGMVRLHTKRILDRLDVVLPKLDIQERPRGARIVEFLQKYAPDPHAALQRVSLRTGLELEALRRAADLDASDTALLEDAVKDILGLETLSI